MNKNNYCTVKAAQRLEKTGIVIKTEKYWVNTIDGWELFVDDEEGAIPAPMFTEVWRELPARVEITREHGMTCAVALLPTGRSCSGRGSMLNPTDALIDLLIFTKSLDKPKSM